MVMEKMLIGVDFDNTIVCYDEVFHRIALEKGLLPAEISSTKECVRNYLRKVGKEDLWTEMQGLVYGTRMKDVAPFPGVIDFFSTLVKKGVPVYIVSHKTKYPYSGPRYDLHKAAFEWLEYHGFFDKERIGLDYKNIFFETTKEKKLDRISERSCTHFIDDLPEFLLEAGFPGTTDRLLFAPSMKMDSSVENGITRAFSDWHEIKEYLLNNGNKL